MHEDAPKVKVGGWIYDQRAATISNSSETLQLKSRLADTLSYFIAHRDQVISKDELMQSVWQTIVSDNAITRVITRLRQALGDDPQNPEYILTVQRKGYRLIAPCEIISEAASPKKARLAISRQLPLYAALILLLGTIGLMGWQISNRSNSRSPAAFAKIIPLTSLRGDEAEPALSPDGRMLAFAHRALDEDWWNIHLKLLRSGEVIQLTDSPMNDRLPAWSHDNSKLVFKRFIHGHCQVIILKFNDDYTAGTESVAMKCDPSAPFSSVAWGPDNESIYYAVSGTVDEPMVLYRKNLLTQNPTQLTSPPDTGRGDYRFAFSPDKRCLGFLRNTNVRGGSALWCYDLETTENSLIYEFETVVKQIAWDADSKGIVFAGADKQLYHLDFNDRRVDLITNSLEPIFYPTAAAGKLVAGSGSFYNQEIWRLEGEFGAGSMATRNPQLWIASSKSDGLPRINPVNESIAFVSDRAGIPQVWIKLPDREYQLSRLQQYSRITAMEWSPQGHRLVALAGGRIGWIEVDSGEHHFIETADSASVANPVWAADGESILFASRKNQEWQILRYEIDSKQIIPVTRNGGYYAAPMSAGELLITKYFEPGIFVLEEGQLFSQPLPHKSLDQTRLLGSWRLRLQPEALYFVLSSHESKLIRQELGDAQPQTLLDIGQDILLGIDVSPDQRHVYYSRYRRDETDIVSIDWGGID